MAKQVKTMRLTESAIEVIHKVMEEEKINSEALAVGYIISEYEKRQSLAEEIVETFNRMNKPWMDRVKFAASAADDNSLDLIHAVNTILYELGYEYPIDIDKFKNKILLDAEKNRKIKKSHFKQVADSKKRKEGKNE
ncbi:MAG: hypothetical protein ACRCUS_08265 [Anaerovoracaceae bacterium]